MPNKLPELQLPSHMQDNRSQRDELKAASIKFLGNVKARLGEYSRQLFDVHKTLDLFQKGTLSKREAYKTILDTLDGHDDLRQELADILMHPAARWGADDFDLPIQPLLQTPLGTAPHYLQPAHELQMPLPSLSSWVPIPQNDRFASLPTFNGYNDCGREQSFVSSPSLPILSPFQLHISTARLWPDLDADAAYTSLHGHDFMAAPVHTTFRNSEGSLNYADNWANDETKFQADNTNFDGRFEFQQPPTLPFCDRYEASLPLPHHAETFTMPTLSQQETPHSPYTPQDVSLPTEHDSSNTTKSEEHSAYLHALPTPYSQSPPGISRTEDAGETAEAEEASITDRSQSLGLHYFHNLCGKAFSTLTGVKKHHWGKKTNDLATTTGCWAKHNKPDVAWDDHPSCKDRRSISVVNKTIPPTTKQRQTKSSLPPSKMPSVINVPQFQAVPISSTLEDLPHTVAKAVHGSNASGSSTQEPEVIKQMPRLASRSSFDSLLTAVNLVSQIDAPKPKCRVDSIAQNLDAQIAAAEQQHPFISNTPSGSSLNLLHCRAVTPAALVMTGSPFMGGHSNSVNGYRVNYLNEEHSPLLPSDVEASHVTGAISRPFQSLTALSSGPARKKRKV
ncbi:hypothetical protein E8E12_006434 [Didymella heteroderae]|uniref:Uncharacterized protein n=1 Tax=Didymella heteroderae TaxID=1769908 RepID=A0A9P4WSA4_9PLEO|nr:hypothetical protein E8E12_006434 [Didymella heteroderae]